MNLTLEERVRIARQRLILIQASANVDADMIGIDEDAISGAIAEAAREALDALNPLTDVPARIANWEAREKGGA